jgi:hypothetical protein
MGGKKELIIWKESAFFGRFLVDIAAGEMISIVM